jgi:hypothetical protein
MTSITVDPVVSEQELRFFVYQGSLILFGHVSSAWDLAQFTRSELEALFASHDPQDAHKYFSPDDGIAFAFPWHRDTWYAAPVQLLN